MISYRSKKATFSVLFEKKLDKVNIIKNDIDPVSGVILSKIMN